LPLFGGILLKFEVIGAGALGMLVTASLAEAGAQVELVTRTRKQAEAVKGAGILLTKKDDGRRNDLDGVTMFPTAVHTYENAQQESGQGTEADYILLMVKQTAIDDSFARFVASRLLPNTKARLVCFQNGIGHVDILARHIPEYRLLLAVTTEGALRHSETHVEHTGSGMTWIGAIDSVKLSEPEADIQKKLVILLNNAGFNVSLSNQITSKVWNKLLINAIINPLTAILQVTNGTLPELPAAAVLMRSLYTEAGLLVDKLGIELAPDLWEQVQEVCRRTAQNRSSMLQDVQSRRRTELESITGGLLAKAKEVGLLLPTHEAVYGLVRSMEQQWERII
jgi:2-dehydropantoate 2-reductase